MGDFSLEVLPLEFLYLPVSAATRNELLLIAGTQSGCGKTTVALALMQYLRAQNMLIAPFKAGPDFLDPMWHAVACDRTSYNLDTRMMGEEACQSLFADKGLDADVCVIEGVMGLYDGVSGVGGEGSSAHLAKVLNEPVLLVVNAKGMSGSIVPLVEGFVARSLEIDVQIAGIIANHVGSENHAKILRELLEKYDLPPLVAWLNKDAPSLPERHLGLKMPSELDLPDFSNCLHVEKGFTVAPQKTQSFAEKKQHQFLQGKILAVAKDKAFCFIYPANVEWLKSQGAEVVCFSPLSGDPVPEGADALWLPGGYPELHLHALEQSSTWSSLRSFIESGQPVLAECGGMMVLGQSITDKMSKTAQMANVLPCSFTMQDKLAGLGYRAEELGVTGHEFHHSKRENVEDLQPCFEVNRGDVGIRYKNLRASYIHWYFSSQPEEVASWFSM